MRLTKTDLNARSVLVCALLIVISYSAHGQTDEICVHSLSNPLALRGLQPTSESQNKEWVPIEDLIKKGTGGEVSTLVYSGQRISIAELPIDDDFKEFGLYERYNSSQGRGIIISLFGLSHKYLGSVLTDMGREPLGGVRYILKPKEAMSNLEIHRMNSTAFKTVDGGKIQDSAFDFGFAVGVVVKDIDW